MAALSNRVRSEREKKNAELSYYAATQGMVLLENKNQVLPINKFGRIALFGLGAVRTVRGGTGSGDPFNGGLSGGGSADIDLSDRYHIHILDAFEQAGYEIVNSDYLRRYAEGYDASKKLLKGNPLGTFVYPEQLILEEEAIRFAKACDTAICVISRNSGEGADRHMYKEITINNEIAVVGDYLLCDREISNLNLLRKTFDKTIVVLNVSGVIDLKEIKKAQIQGLLLMGQAGQEGGRAVMNVLNGTLPPSGKLTDTWAIDYFDYPASKTFADQDGNVDVEKYEEGIYVGYRYFDKFDIKPAYEFGYGLSYTEFIISFVKVEYDCVSETVSVEARVENIGKQLGAEVVQIYFSAPESVLEMPVQELAGFQKTRSLKPGEYQELTITIPLCNLASFHEEKEAYLLSKGSYIFRLGNSSRNTAAVFRLYIDESVFIEQLSTALPLKMELKELSRRQQKPSEQEKLFRTLPMLQVSASELITRDNRSAYADEKVITYTTDPNYQAVMWYEEVQLMDKRKLMLKDVLEENATLVELIAQFSDEELTQLNCGTGWGVSDEEHPVIGDSSESIPGAAGETTHILENIYGIPSMILADGPGGIRVKQEFTAINLITGEEIACYHYCTAWPVGTLLAQSFDPALVKKVGCGIGEEMVELGISILLAPGMNIHRDPLCGRSFEYYSEDPRLTGWMAAAFTKGVQSHPGAGVCLKHYAANNQETNRSCVDTIIGQRALREIYLKGFEIAVKAAHPRSIMTSYNLINGIPTADSYDLCTNVARGEWGFRGLIMTDWNGGSSTPSKSMHAGNDLIMPGGYSRAASITRAMKTVMPEFDERGQVVLSRLYSALPFYEARWNSFVLDPEGLDIVTAELQGTHKARVCGEQILVDDKPIYSAAASRMDYIRAKGVVEPFQNPVTTKMAFLSDNNRKVNYHGHVQTERSVCRGDLQRCALHNLYVIMNSLAMRQM